MDIPAATPPEALPPVYRSAAYRPPARKTHWPSAGLLVIALLGLSGLWGMAVLLALAQMLTFMAQETSLAELTNTILLASGFFVLGAALIPTIIYSILRLSNRADVIERINRRVSGRVPWQVWLIGLPVVVALGIAAGSWIYPQEQIAWLLMPPVHILVVVLPVVWLAYLGVRRISLGSPQRAWGVLAGGIVLGPAIIMAIELAAVLVGVMVLIMYVVLNPELEHDLNLLLIRLSYASTNPQDIFKLIRPYAIQPVLIYLMLAFVAGFVPLVEELFKVIGAWFLLGRGITPARGFAAGVISGAAFALFENVAYTTMDEAWTQIVIVRIGSALLHVATAGLTGWGLGSAWAHRRYWLLGLTYLAAVLMHSLWNGGSVLMGIGSILTNEEPNDMDQFIMLAVPMAAMLIVLLVLNARLQDRKAAVYEAPSLPAETNLE